MRVVTYSVELEDNQHPMLVKEASVNYTEKDSLKNSTEIYELMRDVFKLHKKAEEHVYLMSFNNNMRLLGLFEISHGGVKEAFASNRSIFIRALLSGAAYIILVHNHPSGNVAPSKSDVQITERLKAAGEMMDVPLLDHIIVAGMDYYSFKEAQVVFE